MPERCYCDLLSSREFLDRYRDGSLCDWDGCRLPGFLAAKRMLRESPDYALTNRWRSAFAGIGSRAAALYRALNCLAREYLFYRGRSLFLIPGRLEAWQNLITVLSPTLLSAFAAHRKVLENGLEEQEGWELASGFVARTTLPSPFSPLLDDLVAGEGLHEIHIHLNGTTEADFVWQESLHRPELALENLAVWWRRSQLVRDFYLENGIAKLSDLGRFLRAARYLRQLMVDNLWGCRREGQPRLPVDLQELLTPGWPWPHDRAYVRSDIIHPVAWFVPNPGAATEYNAPQYEAVFFLKAFDALRSGWMLAPAFHVYLLLQSLFIRLVVQQVGQRGFDQFEKIARNELRALPERVYAPRARQLQGRSGQDLASIEGRFSPRGVPGENIKLFKKIMEGFSAIKCLAGRPEWTLVAHFIKEQDDGKGSCRHCTLRQTIRRNAGALVRAREICPGFRNKWVGADAANNEMAASPEIFAPVFRYLRWKGMDSFTFHVGEDYMHLASGLRAVHEAILFLGLKPGDRIGHGTALGISPKLWMERMPEVDILQEDHLDNLVWLYGMLSRESDFLDVLSPIKEEARDLFRKVYKLDPPEMDMMVAAWRMRELDPLVALDISDPREEWEMEMERVEAARKGTPIAFNIFSQYHAREPWQGWGQYMKVQAGLGLGLDQDKTVQLYRVLQNRVVQLMNDKGLLLEVMPTSNVRISFYPHFGEHHLFTWLTDQDQSRPRPRVCIATDDPGIFSTSLRNEFALVDEVLRARPGFSPERVRRLLEDLNRNARVARFQTRDDTKLPTRKDLF